MLQLKQLRPSKCKDDEIEVAFIPIMNMWSPAVCEKFKPQQIFPEIHMYSCGAEHMFVFSREIS